MIITIFIWESYSVFNHYHEIITYQIRIISTGVHMTCDMCHDMRVFATFILLRERQLYHITACPWGLMWIFLSLHGIFIKYHLSNSRIRRDMSKEPVQMDYWKWLPISLSVMIGQIQQFLTTWSLEVECKQQKEKDIFRTLLKPLSSPRQHNARNSKLFIVISAGRQV